jgi:exonuclease SbcD
MKKPLGVFVTDTHLSDKTIAVNKAVWRQADALATKLNVKLFHAGDVFNSRKSQTLSVLTAFSEILDSLENVVELIPGNHDKVDYRSHDSYLDAFKHHPKLRVYRIYGGVPVDNGQTVIHMLPYFLEDDKYVDVLNDLLHDEVKSWSEKNVLLTHVAVNGVKNNDASVVDNNIKADMFKRFDKVLVGHYHNRSVVQKKVVYFGSAFQANFGEDVQKGAAVLYDDMSIEYEQFTFPKYIVEKIDVDKLTTEQIDEMHQEHADSDDFVRFKFTGSEEKLKALDTERFKKDGIDVAIVHADIETAISDASNQELLQYNASSLKEEFSEFCKLNELDEKKGLKYLTEHLK